jgi:hypothetical protein
MSEVRPVYGLPDRIAAEMEDTPRRATGTLALLGLVIVLAAATVWYVVVAPSFAAPAAKRACEVVLLESGAPACVTAPARASSTTPAKSAGRAKS